jgi:hypothetical protein
VSPNYLLGGCIRGIREEGTSLNILKKKNYIDEAYANASCTIQALQYLYVKGRLLCE